MRISKNLFQDSSSALVVFLVALPLCLGITFASKVDPISGIIAGIVGGIVVGFLSKSPLSVSGPAAGLAAIVADAITNLPTVSSSVIENGASKVVLVPQIGAFFLAVMLAGVLQIAFGLLKSGFISKFIPNSVIKGMLSAIGLLLILKQVPHLLGRDTDPEGDETFVQIGGENTITSIIEAFKNPTLQAILIGLIGIGVLMLWEQKIFKKFKIFQIINAPFIVVTIGVFISYFWKDKHIEHILENEHFIKLPSITSVTDLQNLIKFPIWHYITSFYVWKVAVVIAIVASIESLLSIEAIDKIDPEARVTPVNKELVAQGVGNIVSGFLGGLPITSVIVRSSANLNAGAKSKLSAILHGILLLGTVLLIPNILNLIPKSSLAAILIFTGYKLIKPTLIKSIYSKGFAQFLPFIITILAILSTDLLKGVIIGVIVSFFYILRSNFKNAITMVNKGNQYLLRTGEFVSFLNKQYIKTELEKIPDNSDVLIDCSQSHFIDYDIQEEINEFLIHAKDHKIKFEIKQRHNQNYLFNTQKQL